MTWYLANDMQFYFVAPIVLIPFALGYNISFILGFSNRYFNFTRFLSKKLIGIIIAALSICASLITTALIMNSNPIFGSPVGM